MARPATITDEQILEAAREVFLAEGFSAQTEKIASRAGVSTGTIFKRFTTKEALFFAALEIDPHPAWHAQAEKLTSEWQGHEGLVALFTSILRYFNEIMPRMITTLGSRVGVSPKETFAGLPEDPRERDQRILGTFLSHAMEAGYLRRCDPVVLARLLMGAAIESTFDTAFDSQERTPEDLSAAAEGVIDVLWDGIRPIS